jgi:protein-disulfide isomerase
MREIWFAALAGLLLVGVHPAAAQAPKAVGKSAENASALAVTNEDRILGKPDAPITIVEYGSLSCPHCAHFTAEVLPQLKKKWIDTGKAKLVFRDFPLDQEALRAEMLTRCAPPERYYPLVELLFENQDKWVTAKDWQGALARLTRMAGIGKTEFDACLANKSVEDQVAQSRLVASQQLGVDSTPTFFVNGKKYEGAPTVEAFDQLLSGLAEKS